MSQLDKIRKKNLLSSPTTVNANWATESASLDDRADAFSLTLRYENGSAVEMTVWLEMSTDNINWARVSDTDVAITDSEGSVIYDVDGSGTQYVRVAIDVTAGSIDVVFGLFSASQYH